MPGEERLGSDTLVRLDLICHFILLNITRPVWKVFLKEEKLQSILQISNIKIKKLMAPTHISLGPKESAANILWQILLDPTEIPCQFPNKSQQLRQQ